jgi:stringent starvation protein B
VYGNEQYIVHLNNVGPKQTKDNPFRFLGYPRRVNIPKEQSESVYRRRTDNTMVIRNSTKGQKRSTKHTHKAKDRVTRTPLNAEGELRCLRSVSCS